MKRAYKYKIKPTVKQQDLLNRFFGCARFIYNWGLDRKIKAYKEEKKNITYVQLAKELTQLKKQEGTEWLSECAITSLQQSLRNLESAYSKFFKEKKGFPKFKSKKHSKDSCKFIRSVHFDFDKWEVTIPKIGKVNMCLNKFFDPSKVKLGTLTVSRDKCGEYWCTIVVEDMKDCRSKAKVCEETAVGIDLGIKDYAVLSDGTKYGNPKFLEKGARRLAFLQKHFSKSQKGSKRHERLRLKIARCYRKIANRRYDFIHKLTTGLVNKFDTICLEDLNVKGMIQNHRLANSIQSAAWNEFARQLKYKCEWGGKNLFFIERFAPSSQTCNSCGYRNSDVKNLAIRQWKCQQCGKLHDRDINAAKNILSFALYPRALVE